MCVRWTSFTNKYKSNYDNDSHYPLHLNGYIPPLRHAIIVGAVTRLDTRRNRYVQVGNSYPLNGSSLVTRQET